MHSPLCWCLPVAFRVKSAADGAPRLRRRGDSDAQVVEGPKPSSSSSFLFIVAPIPMAAPNTATWSDEWARHSRQRVCQPDSELTPDIQVGPGRPGFDGDGHCWRLGLEVWLLGELARAATVEFASGIHGRVLLNIFECYIAFRVCYMGKTGMVYSQVAQVI